MSSVVNAKIAIYPIIGIFCLLYAFASFSTENSKEEEILARTSSVEGIVTEFEKRKILTGNKKGRAAYTAYFMKLDRFKEYEVVAASKFFADHKNVNEVSIDIFNGKKAKLLFLEDKKVYQIEIEGKTALSFSDTMGSEGPQKESGYIMLVVGLALTIIPMIALYKLDKDTNLEIQSDRDFL